MDVRAAQPSLLIERVLQSYTPWDKFATCLFVCLLVGWLVGWLVCFDFVFVFFGGGHSPYKSHTPQVIPRIISFCLMFWANIVIAVEVNISH